MGRTSEYGSHKVYRSIVGSMNWFANRTRYDISHSLSRLSQHLEKPTKGCMAAARRVMSYLAGTVDMTLTADITAGDDVWDQFVDSDHAGDRKSPTGTRSHTGVITLLNGMPVMWKSNKQPVTSVSSAAAEIHALGDAVRYSNCMGYRTEEMGIHVEWPRNIMIDNASAVSFQQKTNADSRLGGTFDNREDWIVNMKDKSKVNGVKVNTIYNMSDILTKCHAPATFNKLVGLVQGRHEDLSSQSAWFRGKEK